MRQVVETLPDALIWGSEYSEHLEQLIDLALSLDQSSAVSELKENAA